MERKELLNSMQNTGLTKEEINAIKSVFTSYPKVEEVILYGSRAMGNFKPASDIDLSIIGEIDRSLESDIFFDLDDLMFPYKFDLSIYNKISNPDLITHIDKQGILIFSAKN